MIEMRPGSDVATEAWRGLHGSELAQTHIDLRAWPEAESRLFLEELLFVHAGQMLVDRGLERRIVDHVLRYAVGNPMQMIEHVRVLVDNGWLRTGPDGSAVFDFGGGARDAELAGRSHRGARGIYQTFSRL